MSKHTAPRAEPDRNCTACGALKAAERFGQDARGRRLAQCEACHAKRMAPRPCARCGEATAPDAFPRLPSGGRSKYCAPCREAGLPKRPCAGCGESKPAEAFFRYASGQRSRTCEPCRRPAKAPIRCIRCGTNKAPDAFHVYPSGSRALSCQACRRPRPRGPKGVNVAPTPCKVCRGPIQFDEPPSHLAARKTCSPACAAESRRRNDRVCCRCKRSLPWDAFDAKTNSRSRRGSCRQCTEDATDDRRPDLARRPSVHQLRLNVQKMAEGAGRALALRPAEIRRLHGSPCGLCGQAVSAIVPTDPEGPIDAKNSVGVCRTCRRLLRLVPMSELVLHCNEVAAYRPLDPDRLGGFARCRCTKSKPSASSGSGTRSGGA